MYITYFYYIIQTKRKKEQHDYRKSTRNRRRINRIIQCIFRKNALNDVKTLLLRKWGLIKNNEEILSVALKENHKSLTAPGIIGLTILDYKNVDPIAFDVVRTIILKDNYFRKELNPLFNNLQIPFISSFLLHNNLEFTSSEQEIITNAIRTLNIETRSLSTYLLYNHPQFGISTIKKYPTDLSTTYFDNLLKNYEERAKIRRLTTLPF